MHSVLSKSGAVALGFLMLVVGTGAQAALVNFTLTGEVQAGAGYGLVAGATITASGTFDDSALSVDPYSVPFGGGSGNAMTISVGSLTLDAALDEPYLADTPRLEFSHTGDLLGLSYDVFGLPDGGEFWSAGFAFSFGDGEMNFAAGSWDAGSFAMTPVPVPAAVWLMSSGLLGLAGLARRGRRSVSE